MRFDQLNQSIELNAEESPSLYNALNMIRSLFRDVADSADLPLSECPIGDEKLPLEMIWLSKEILKIYDFHNESLQRNRTRLDSIMEKLRSAQVELAKFADAQKLLPIKSAEYQELEKQLSAARAAQAAYEKVLEDIKTAQAELALLQRFDFDAAQQKLLDLTNQIQQLQDRIRELDTQIQNLTNEKSRLCGDLSQLRADLLALQEELVRLAAERDALLDQKQQAERLRAELIALIEAARAELAQLQEFIREASQLLRDLEDQVRILSEEKCHLAAQIDQLRKAIEQLQTDIANLRYEYNDILLPEHKRLTEEKQSLLNRKRQMEEEIADLIAETTDLNAELLALRASLSQRIRERDEIKKAVDDYRQNVLDPVITERDHLLATEQQLQTEKTTAEQQITQLNTNQRALILEIGRKKDRLEHDTKEYEKHVSREKELALDQEALTLRLNTAIDALQIRQAEHDKLQKEDLPAAEKYLADETQRRDALQKKVDDIHAECQDKHQEIDRMNSDLPALKEKLRNLQQNYDALTITYNASNSDIVELERKIRELEKKNDQERLAQYRAQQTEKKQHLEALAELCAKLEQEIYDLGQQVQTETEKRLILEDRKKTQEEGLRGIRNMLEELKPWAAPEKRLAAENTKRQFDTLLLIRNNLAKSVSDASRQIINRELSGSELQILDYEIYLENASSRSRDLCKSLHECAEVLKNYITEEPK